MDIFEESVKFHEDLRGKTEVAARAKIDGRKALSLAYTPGVAGACREIEKNPDRVYELTRKWNTVAVISDGSAVLGLGNIGPLAGLPVMEGKAVLFKEFGGVDAVPIMLGTQNTEEIIAAIAAIAPTFAGINLEDISAPRCFEIESRLKKMLDIPVFHDDQHGTAIVVLAAVINALKLSGKKKESVKAVICGAGSAGIAISKLLIGWGIKNLILTDRLGIVEKSAPWLNEEQKRMADISNPEGIKGMLSDAIQGSDIFIGVSAANVLSAEMVSTMNDYAAVFAMANPTPEIMPDAAIAAGAKIVGTGRSDFANQINNVLAFPGIFKGAISVRASDISEGMKLSAATAIAALAERDGLRADYILPDAFDSRVGEAVAAAVADCAKKENLSRL